MIIVRLETLAGSNGTLRDFMNELLEYVATHKVVVVTNIMGCEVYVKPNTTFEELQAEFLAARQFKIARDAVMEKP